MRTKAILLSALSIVLTGAVLAQVVTSRLSGTVTDPQGAAIAGAQVAVINEETGARFETTTSEHGEWNVPSLPAGNYKVTISASGFKTAVFPGVTLEANIPGTVNAKLQIGAVTERIEVQGGAEVVQTESATVSSTMTGRQISDLPFVSRNALDLLVSQVGTSTVGTQRSTSINGLQQSTMNITLDGINIQDNDLKSSDGFLAWLMPRADSVEEVSIQTAALGAESSSEGSSQIKFITRSGTNQLHGGLFWQIRNDFFDANYYFNTINRLPRDKINMNQFGGRLGGPIRSNRLFFFFSYEELRLPQSNNSSALLMTGDAMKGLFTYKDTGGVLRTIDLYALAAAGNAALPAGTRAYSTTPDPTLLSTYQKMASLATPSSGTLRERITRYADYSRNDFLFQNPGHNHRRWPTLKLDWNASSKHQVGFVWRYQSYVANPDVVNSVVPVMPGTGAVLGTDATGAQRRIAFSAAASVRSVLTPRITSEARFGTLGGPMLLRDDINPGQFAQWKGYAPAFGGWVTNPYTGSSNYRRNPPIWQGSEGLTWSRGSHLFNFGGSFSRIDMFVSNLGVAAIPGISFGTASTDPIATGATSLFTTTNFPNSTTANRNDAASLYVLLTGRVSSISRSVNLDEKTHQYGPYPAIDRVHQTQYGLYLQDAWKVRPGLTLNYGVRWDMQLPYVNTNGIYSKVGYDELWGVSGTGNLFLPGYMPGKPPQFLATRSDEPAWHTYWKSFDPSLGFAWQTPANDSGWRRWLLGRHGVVVRGGYSIASVREGMDVFLTNGWGSNQGQTLTLNVASGTNAEFGAPGSVWFRDSTLPARSYDPNPSYPIPVVAGNGVYDYAPNLRPGYVQSWNFSVQREIRRNTVLDVRYVGNHGTSLWRRFNLNEVNIIENGFLDEFKVAQNNLAIARVADSRCAGGRLSAGCTVNFGNQGLPGQKNLPIISTAWGTTNDTTFAQTYLDLAQAGRAADAIAFNATRMGRLQSAGYPANFFVVNPTTGSGSAMVTTNGGHSTYNALQVEVRRRMASGLQIQGSYAWAKSLGNMFSSRSGARSQPTTLRNPGYDKGPSPWDIRNNIKMNLIYELPFGPGRRFVRSGSPVLGKVVEGWQIAAVTRIQSGTPELIRSGRMVLNSTGNDGVEADGGVVLHNMTTSQFQSMVHVRKTGGGIVYFLPQQVIDNTMAAFEVGGRSLKDLDPNAPYVGPPTVAGQLGNRVFLYGPWQQHYDFSVSKRTKIAEKKEIEFRAQLLNVFNLTNFYFGLVAYQTIGAGFGQTTTSYRDFTIAGTNNPGSRVIEFSLRFNF